MGSGSKSTRIGYPILFSLILIFAIIELALSGWLTSRYNSRHNNRTSALRVRIRYILFTSAWTVLFSAIYLVMFMIAPTGSILTSVASNIVFLFITWVFWLAAAAAITQTLGGGLSCSTQTAFVYCGQLNATEGFAWALWILFSLALILVTIRGITAARRGDGMRGGLVSA